LAQETIKTYSYGMRCRGFSIGCQPKKGFLMVADDNAFRQYHDLLVYDRRLTEQECEDYELDYLGEGKMPKSAIERL